MKDQKDTSTIDFVGTPKKRGRPPISKSGVAMTPAQRVAKYRRKLKHDGIRQLTVNLDKEVYDMLMAYQEKPDCNIDTLINQLVRSRLVKR